MARSKIEPVADSRRSAPARRSARSRSSGRRFSDLASLEKAVKERCAVEFQARWPFLDVEAVREYALKMKDRSARSATARRALSRLLEEVQSCLQIASRDDAYPTFSYIHELKVLGPQLCALEESFGRIAHVEFDAARPMGSSGLAALRVFRDPPYALTFREAVFWRFAAGLWTGEVNEQDDDLPSPRQLAVASLLAGQEIDHPRGAGTTVSEVIIKETKAMREVARCRSWLRALVPARIGQDDPSRWVSTSVLADVRLR